MCVNATFVKENTRFVVGDLSPISVQDGEVLCEIPVRNVKSRFIILDLCCGPKRCGRGSRRELPRPAQEWS
jgi:hypothetical protein